MGILSKFRLGKRKEIPKLENLPLPPKEIGLGIGLETAEMSNLKAKIDLVMTQLENMAIRYQTLNEKIDRIEKMIEEIYMMAKKA